jgi:SAM-dependent methyltransferase
MNKTNIVPSKPEEVFLCRARTLIDELDFTQQKNRMALQDNMGWGTKKLDFVENQYRNMLYLWAKYSDMIIPPSKDIDEFWHNHILDTIKYHKETTQIFGHYLHHIPAFGMDNEHDFHLLMDGYRLTCSLYEKEFGEKLCDIEEVLGRSFIIQKRVGDLIKVENFPSFNTAFGVQASNPKFQNYPELVIPHPSENGKIKTLNNMGYSDTGLEKEYEHFINLLPRDNGPILDIGAGFGIASLLALQRGLEVVANDIDKRHLFVLRQLTPKTLLHKLHLNPSKFPTNLEFEKNSFSSVLMIAVIHFLRPQEIIEGLKKMSYWIKPGGCVHIVSMTPYHHLLKKFRPVYENRIKENKKWPGIIEDPKSFFPEISEHMPHYFNLMDEIILEDLLREANFNVVHTSFFPRNYSSKDFIKITGQLMVSST